MGDLARAIVDLAAAAEGRRGARKKLAEATDSVARSIRGQLRTGDSVQIPRADEPSRVAANKPSLTYTAWRVSYRPQGGGVRAEADVLLREMAVLEDLGGSSMQSAATTMHPGLYPIHPATAEEREAFIGEVEAVVAAFRDLLESQAKRLAAAADQATKLVPR